MRTSVIIPAYKADWCIERCIRSIEVQEYPPDEILIGVDACQDTLKKCMELAKSSEIRIRIFYFPQHAGCYRIRNTLAMLSNSDVLVLFDADDEMEPEYCREMIYLAAPGRFVRPVFTDRYSDGSPDHIGKYPAEGCITIFRQDVVMMAGWEPWQCAADSEFRERAGRRGIRWIATEDSVMIRHCHNSNLTRAADTGLQSEYRKKLRQEMYDRRKTEYQRDTISVSPCREITRTFRFVEDMPLESMLESEQSDTKTTVQENTQVSQKKRKTVSVKFKRLSFVKPPVVSCVLRSGGDFSAEDVYILERNLRNRTDVPFEFRCLSDTELKCGHTRMNDCFPGWWSKLELFRPGLFNPDSQIFYFDLDTVITGDISSYLKSCFKFGMLKSFKKKGSWASGMMSWKGDFSLIYHEAGKISDFRKGDQDMIIALLRKFYNQNPENLNDRVKVYSYKRSCREKLPNDAEVVCFHGKPRPSDVFDEWVVNNRKLEEIIPIKGIAL